MVRNYAQPPFVFLGIVRLAELAVQADVGSFILMKGIGARVLHALGLAHELGHRHQGEGPHCEVLNRPETYTFLKSTTGRGTRRRRRRRSDLRAGPFAASCIPFRGSQVVVVEGQEPKVA